MQSAKVARLVRKSQSQIAGLLQKQAKERLVRRPPAASPPRSSRTAEEQHKFRRLRGERRERDKGRQKHHVRPEAAKVVAAAAAFAQGPVASSAQQLRSANFMPWSTRVRFATFCCRPRTVPSGEGSGRVTPSTTGGAATRCASPRWQIVCRQAARGAGTTPAQRISFCVCVCACRWCKHVKRLSTRSTRSAKWRRDAARAQPRTSGVA